MRKGLCATGMLVSLALPTLSLPPSVNQDALADTGMCTQDPCLLHSPCAQSSGPREGPGRQGDSFLGS